jgi:hypothetical protein
MKPSVSLVVRPDELDKVEKWTKYFTEKNNVVNLLPELNPGVDWRGTPEWKRLESISKKYKRVNLIDDESIPKSFEFKKYDYCTAGMHYFCAISDGTIYRCYSDMIRGDSIGNIFEFRPDTEPRRCGKECLGCAIDHRQEKWNEPSRLIIPEEARIAA